MNGRRVVFVPGADCHGLPIEMKVSTAAAASVTSPSQTNGSPSAISHEKAHFHTPSSPRNAREVIERCRTFAAHWAEQQQQQLKSLGVLASWHRSYSTMSPAYEGAVMDTLAHLVAEGRVMRKLRTVPTCTRCGTVLAAAELQACAAMATDAAYVTFPLQANASTLVANRLKVELAER